jgi:hypothetical protein
MKGPLILNCEAAQESITLFVYGELSDEGCHELEQHLLACATCREEMEVTRALTSAMAIFPVRDPSPNLLAQTRLRLDEALDAVPRGGWLSRMLQSLRTDFYLLRTAPVATAALVLAGIGVGGLGGYHHALHLKDAERAAAVLAPVAGAAEPVIAGVSRVSEQPGSGTVKIEYDKVTPAVAEGSPEDPMIRQLLVAAAVNRYDPTVQSSAVDLLANACQKGRLCIEDGPVRHALMVALRYDPSVEVRRRALQGLEPYLSEDTRVRDAVLEAVMDDRDASVREQAISMLHPVETDSSVRQVLHTVASGDGNPQLRTISREVLDDAPQIQ